MRRVWGYLLSSRSVKPDWVDNTLYLTEGDFGREVYNTIGKAEFYRKMKWRMGWCSG
jgi:hypothetical protein